MKRILLSNGEFTLISDCDYIWASGFSWCLGTHNYPCNSNGQLLHRLIAGRMNLDCSEYVDHINRDRLDARRKNLRAATNSQNQMNQSMSCNNTSGYKGVHWNIRNQKWEAYIKINRKRIHLGNYDRIEQAILRVNRRTKVF